MIIIILDNRKAKHDKHDKNLSNNNIRATNTFRSQHSSNDITLKF